MLHSPLLLALARLFAGVDINALARFVLRLSKRVLFFDIAVNICDVYSSRLLRSLELEGWVSRCPHLKGDGILDCGVFNP